MTTPSGTSPESRLRELGTQLPRPPRARGLYVPGKVAGSLLFVSGAYGTQPDPDGEGDSLPISGQLGAGLTIAEGQASARLVALNLLAMARAMLGTLQRLHSVVRLVGYVNAAPEFREAPRVLDAASRLLIDLFGAERGSHAYGPLPDRPAGQCAVDGGAFVQPSFRPMWWP